MKTDQLAKAESKKRLIGPEPVWGISKDIGKDDIVVNKWSRSPT